MTKSHTKDGRGLLTVDQVAELLNCSSRHVRRLADRGAMPSPLHIGVLLRWNRQAVESWIASGCPNVQKGRAES